MRLTRTLPCIALLAFVAGCDVLGSDSPPLRIEGRVISSATQQPIAGATVSIGYSNILNGASGRLPDRATDAQGRFTAQIDEIRGYARPNCAAVSVIASAPGYNYNGTASIDGPADDPTCIKGRATVDIRLTPQQ
jgi:hypothetical protein